ncbi:cytochrome P450 [Paractinoplanes atraurantiacus]|uniref:Cytochrome P450 n=1 Tax=Paractinoplanes atraurantiacus TaxID=1036182 RepID=A0A285GQA0_9ACTN|nr:cytochrome P450 [Actinoplanes atraurantiacus]SNY24521.1 Cytochrome P450 [Actinoplanes atraurantiacus]
MSAATLTAERFPPPRPAERPLGIPEDYRRMFAGARVPHVLLPSGRTAHLLGRYEDVRAVLTGPVSADGAHPGFPMVRAGTASTSNALSFFRMDGADHRRYRRLVAADFSVAQVARMRPRLERIVDELIDGMLAGDQPADLATMIALPLPTQVICHILGVPYTDRASFQQLSDTLTRGPEHGRESFLAAVMRLQAYVEKLAVAKRDEPGDDLLSALIENFDHDDSLDRRQLAAMVLLLLVAGHETTASMITLGALALIEHPHVAEAVRADPGVTPNVAEELLRYISIAQWVPRVATEEIVLGDTTIRAGEGLIALPLMANRDPDVFANPDALEPYRWNADRHLGFGFGPHQCLGVQLARMELQVVFEALACRLPGLRLAVPVGELALRQQSAMFGVESLPVTW